VKVYKKIFSRRWWLATLMVLVAVGILIRLGIWQLDRLDQRRIFNARVNEQQNEPVLRLDENSLKLDLYNMEYRKVTVEGIYLADEEIVLRNQSLQGQLGRQLFTPLQIEGSDSAILIQRGWIPEELSSEDARHIYSLDGNVEIAGVLRRAETDFGINLNPDPELMEGEIRLDAWNHLDLNRLQQQMKSQLLPVYLQLLPDEANVEGPIAIEFNLDLSEGSHLGYAGQWFMFSLVLLIGYPLFINKEEKS
jgi:surfeit locus 1 family protein